MQQLTNNLIILYFLQMVATDNYPFHTNKIQSDKKSKNDL